VKQPDDMHELRVLVVEDDYVIALDLATALLELGVQVIGPVSTTDEALQLVRERSEELDAAILDINLGSHTVYPVADALRERAVPFVFATGYDGWSIPETYRDVARCSKPIDPVEVMRHLGARQVH
jgi:CheY-like chemotaxis protein